MSLLVNVVVVIFVAATRLTNGMESNVCADGSCEGHSLLQAKIGKQQAPTETNENYSIAPCFLSGDVYYYYYYPGIWGKSYWPAGPTVCNPKCEGDDCIRLPTASPTPPTPAPTPAPTTPAPTWSGEPSDLKSCHTFGSSEGSCSSVPHCVWISQTWFERIEYTDEGCYPSSCADSGDQSSCERKSACAWNKNYGTCMPDATTPTCVSTGNDYYYFSWAYGHHGGVTRGPVKPTRCSPWCYGLRCSKCAQIIQSKEACKTAAEAQEGLQWDGTRNWPDRLFGCLKTADGDVNWNTDEYGINSNSDQEPLCA